MRKIRFRGQSADGQWHEGFYTEGGLVNPETSEITKRYLIDDDVLLNDVKPDTVGQMADTTDSLGKPIFEGDILHNGDPNIRYVVVWHDNGLIAKQIGSRSYIGLEHWQNHITLMGNRFDNPELLKK